MRPEELRIGNLVQSEYQGIVKVDSSHISLLELGYINLEPIQITLEWIDVLSFKNQKGYVLNKSYVLSYKGIKLKEIKYVHTLQNIWVILTNEELNIKIKKYKHLTGIGWWCLQMKNLEEIMSAKESYKEHLKIRPTWY